MNTVTVSHLRGSATYGRRSRRMVGTPFFLLEHSVPVRHEDNKRLDGGFGRSAIIPGRRIKQTGHSKEKQMRRTHKQFLLASPHIVLVLGLAARHQCRGH